MYNRLWNRWSTTQHYTKAGEDGGFRIDPGTGEVALTRSLDRERTPVHSLLVQAW